MEMTIKMTSQIKITAEDVRSARWDSSVLVLTGTDEARHERVTFGADLRPAAALIDYTINGGETVAEVENWQILSRRAA